MSGLDLDLIQKKERKPGFELYILLLLVDACLASFLKELQLELSAVGDTVINLALYESELVKGAIIDAP